MEERSPEAFLKQKNRNLKSPGITCVIKTFFYITLSNITLPIVKLSKYSFHSGHFGKNQHSCQFVEGFENLCTQMHVN